MLSRAQAGLDAPLVQVRGASSAGGGLPGLSIVGLPVPVVRESCERVRAALLSGGYVFLPGRITVNLTPAELSRRGGRFDLPIAPGVLCLALSARGVHRLLALGRTVADLAGRDPIEPKPATGRGDRAAPSAVLADAALRQPGGRRPPIFCARARPCNRRPP